MTSRVTVGIPVVDELDQLQLAVKSVFAQTLMDWRLLIVCDGSSQEVVDAAHAITDPRVTVISDDRSLGLPARLNQITRLSDSEFVARMDADDVMHPERLERQLAYLTAHPGTDVLATASWVIDETDTVLGGNTDPGVPKRLSGYLGRTPYCHPSVMFSKDWALRFPYSETLRRAQDKELWLRSAPSSTIARLPERLMFYRIASARPGGNRKRLNGYVRDLHLIRKYWRAVRASRLDALRQQSRVVVRIALLPIIALPGFRTATQHVRHLHLTHAELAHAQSILAKVASTPVPGWGPCG